MRLSPNYSPEFKQVLDPVNGARKPGNTAHPIVRAPSDDFPDISPFLFSFHGAKRAIVGWDDHVDYDLPAGDLEPPEGLEESFHFDDAHAFRDGDDDDFGARGRRQFCRVLIIYIPMMSFLRQSVSLFY